MEGTIIKSTGTWCVVRTAAGKKVDCVVKGNFRLKGTKTTNPVSIGDNVTFEYSRDGVTGIVTSVLDRKNYIVRRATKLSKVYHIIAANIDQACLVVTLAEPRTSTGFMDRFLVTAEAYHIPAFLVFNKIDIYDEALASLHEKLTSLYDGIGYKCFGVSALRGDNLNGLRESLAGKVSLFSGHSGVGKSALINALEPSFSLKTAEISHYHQKGMHTTTFAEMLELSSGGFIIDTPGIKEFGLIDFNRQEVCERFPEMRALMYQCQFSNCTHVHEPNCAVKKALEEGHVSQSRYLNYLSILNGEYPREYEIRKGI